MCLLRLLASFAFLAAGEGCRQPAEISVTGHGTDRPDPICQSFRLTSGQAATFFRKARPISREELHNFDYLPCWVTGTRRTSNGIEQWTIHPVGVAKVTTRDGQTHLLGCKQCDDLFK